MKQHEQKDGDDVKTDESSSCEDLPVTEPFTVRRFCRFIGADMHVSVRYCPTTSTSTRTSEWNIFRRKCTRAHRQNGRIIGTVQRIDDELDEGASGGGHIFHDKRHGESSNKAVARRERRIVEVADQR